MTDGLSSPPAGLELVCDFVNTHNLLSGRDVLATPGDLAAWLAGRELLASRAHATPADLRRAVAVREAIRALLLGHNGLDVETEPAAALLDSVARRAGLAVRLGPGDESRLEPRASGVTGALGGLLSHVASAMADGTWSRAKACRADDCRYAFFDRARNRSRTWCSMEDCGNREKARAFRRRHDRRV